MNLGKAAIYEQFSGRRTADIHRTYLWHTHAIEDILGTCPITAVYFHVK